VDDDGKVKELKLEREARAWVVIDPREHTLKKY